MVTKRATRKGGALYLKSGNLSPHIYRISRQFMHHFPLLLERRFLFHFKLLHLTGKQHNKIKKSKKEKRKKGKKEKRKKGKKETNGKQ